MTCHIAKYLLAAKAVCDRGARRAIHFSLLWFGALGWLLGASSATAQPGFLPIDNLRHAQPAYRGGSSATVARPISGGAPQTPHPAIVRVVVAEKEGISLGSGTLIDVRGEWGLVISNWHVVRDAAGPIQIQFANGYVAPATVVKTDSDWDLAALSVHKPSAAPIPLAGAAPQPGEPLSIAGYGSGSYRVASGRVTQYLAPGVKFPYEIVEVSAEARQGDSGGPILNARGELAGVLFGSAGGLTSGSYVGRVREFLVGVLPAGNALPGAAAPMVASPAPRFPVPSTPQMPGNLPPFATELAQANPASSGWKPATSSRESLESSAADQPREPSSAGDRARIVDQPLTQVGDHVGNENAPLMDAPPPSAPERAIDLSPATRPVLEATPADRLAVVDEPRAVALQSLEDEEEQPTSRGLGIIHSPLPPRSSQMTTAGGISPDAPAEQLLAAAWRQIAGSTFYDQAKTVFAVVGILLLLGHFYRMNAQPEEEVHPEEE